MPQVQDDRFVWNDEHPEVIKVRHAELLEGYTARLEFSDGSTRQIDLEQYLHGPVFQPLRDDPEIFRRMRVEGGTLTWENGADIAPETLYEDSHPVQVKPRSRAAKRPARTTRRRTHVAG